MLSLVVGMIAAVFAFVGFLKNALVPAAIAAERRAEVAHTEVILLAAAAGPRVTPRSPVPVTQSLFNSTSLLKNIKR